MRRYVWTFVGLMALTALTFGMSFVHLGGWNTSLAMLIGLAKSVLIVFWFMHLAEHRTSSRVAFAVAIGLALCLIAFTVMDVRTRRPPQPVDGAGASGSTVGAVSGGRAASGGGI